MKMLTFDLVLLVVSVAVTISAATKIGVTYSTPDVQEVSPERIVAKVVSMEIEAVRLLDPDPEMIRAFASTKVSLFLSVPNPLVPMLASDRHQAFDWVKLHVLPFHNRTKISMISVGNDLISPEAPPPMFLLQAMQNLRKSLLQLRINDIPVSTTFSFFSLIASPFPPSLAQFKNPNRFLEKTNSSFLVNLFLTTYMDDTSTIHVRYTNLFDVMVDAVVKSLAVMGHESLPVVVAETGWPTWSSNSSEVDATLRCSEKFLDSLVAHLRAGHGTPLRKEGVSEVYIFELCDSGSKQQSKRTWGLLDNHLKTKMNITFFVDIPEMEKKFIRTYLVIVFSLFAGVIGTVCVLTCLTNILSTERPPKPVVGRDKWL
ncbi:unnamed protein product [Eruca vesicaria subsp. sativa]|uniref:glucan endo-1,3-beta-D-glucosidase n=1 Tax=Eruca vesicaria subsp. sativa TaxID=29727 RepID=A0ABC8JJL5_ERUVS|nr:unnamed protein product [Eruca vesicaria subsp. sativa]